jgi:putative nucleotidyltransferase with HDIG domain
MSGISSIIEHQAEEHLHELVASISNISTLPTVAARIMEVVNDSTASASDLKDVVECDPALTARILKTVNSSYFSVQSRVGNLQHAISLMGFNTVRNLAVTHSVSGIFKRESEVASYSRMDLWRHMVSVGMSARMIARRLKNPQFEEAFMAGLLHDIGVVLLDEHAHEAFCTAVISVTPDRELCVCEREVFGFDHSDLGATVADQWRFPESIIEGIRWHHTPQASSEANRSMVCILSLADFLCAQKGIGTVRTKCKPSTQLNLLTELGVEREDLRVLWEDMDHELSAARDLFKL